MLAGLDVRLPLETTLEQATYFAPARPGSFAPHHLPLWIWMDDPSYYGFPCYGEPTVKAAQDCGGPVIDTSDPLSRTSEPDPAMQERLAAFMASVLPESGRPVRSIRCQYTLTPDRDFVLAPVPGPRVGRRRPRCRARLQVRADVRAVARRPGDIRLHDLRHLRRSASTGRPSPTRRTPPTGWCDEPVAAHHSSENGGYRSVTRSRA